MIKLSTAPYAALILRLSLGIMFLAHVALKIFVFKIPGFVGYQTKGAAGNIRRSGRSAW